MPELITLSATAGNAEIIDAIHRDGAVIIADLMNARLADRIYDETIDYINHSRAGSAAFTGEYTTRTGALTVRSAGCRELITNEKALGVASEYLAPFCDRVQLHVTQVIRIKPGQPVQPLHRDREAWGKFLPAEIQPQLNTIWALTEFSRENGATRVVPGSPGWEYGRQANEAEIGYAEMPRGSVLIYSGSVIHGGGENKSQMDRIGINITYSLAWLRQEENQYLSCPPDAAREFEPVLQDLLGYTMGSVACGYYSQLLPPGEAKELCPPEFAVGRKPRQGSKKGIIDP